MLITIISYSKHKKLKSIINNGIMIKFKNLLTKSSLLMMLKTKLFKVKIIL